MKPRLLTTDIQDKRNNPIRTPQLFRVGHRNASNFSPPNQKDCEPSFNVKGKTKE